MRDDKPTPYVNTRVIAVGVHTAIGVLELHPAPSRARSARKVAPKLLMHLAYDPALGVRGPLKLPKGAGWVGLGAEDVVLAATADGSLWSAESVDAAIAGRFVKQGRVAGAKRWDANGAAKIVLATAGRSISISADGGASFTRVNRPRPVEAAFVRADGIIVADPRGAPPEVSRDGGVTWTSAPAAVGSLVLVRNGNWVGERDSDGGVTCRSGALAADGETWVSWEYWREKPASRGSFGKEMWSQDGLNDRWNQRLLEHPLYNEDKALRATNAVTDPMPAAVPGDLAAFHARCKPDPLGGAMGGILGSLSGHGEPECHGADCVSTQVQQSRRTPLVQTRTFHDGSPPGRSASAVIVDLRSGRSAFLLPPARCQSALFEDLGGGAVLACRVGDGADLHLAGLDGVWHAAGHITGTVAGAQRASDGTIVLTPRCRTTARDCVGWVRRPAALDDGVVFENVVVPGARAFGPLPGGKVLVAAVAPAHADEKSWVFLNGSDSVFEPAKPAGDADRPRALTDKLGKLADCFHALGAGRQPGEVALHWSKGGTVIDSGPSELASCARRVVGTLPSSLPAGKNVLYFRVLKQAIDVLELLPGQPAASLAQNLAFEGELSTITLDDRGEITFSAYRRRPYVQTRYRVDRGTGTAAPIPEKPSR